jgi:hypothetical protein
MLSSWSVWVWTGMHTGIPQSLFDMTVLVVSLQLTAYGLATCLQVSSVRDISAILTGPKTTGLPRRVGRGPHTCGYLEGHCVTTDGSYA